MLCKPSPEFEQSPPVKISPHGQGNFITGKIKAPLPTGWGLKLQKEEERKCTDQPAPVTWLFHHKSKRCSYEDTKCVWKINAWKVNVSLCSSPEDVIFLQNGQLVKCLHPLRNCPNMCVIDPADASNQSKISFSHRLHTRGLRHCLTNRAMTQPQQNPASN